MRERKSKNRQSSTSGADYFIRETILNNYIQEENRHMFKKKKLRKPDYFFSALEDEYGVKYDENYERPDYKINKLRDIDQDGLFQTTRIFQHLGHAKYQVGLFQYDFGNALNDKMNRFVDYDYPRKKFKEIEDIPSSEDEELYILNENGQRIGVYENKYHKQVLLPEKKAAEYI